MAPKDTTQHLENLQKSLARLEKEFDLLRMQAIPSEVQNELDRKILGLAQKVHSSYRVGVVTALPKEYIAVKQMLDSFQDYPIPGDPNHYCTGVIASRLGSAAKAKDVVVTMLSKMGNNSAAGVAANLLRSFPNIQDVLMVGIAGGIPNPRDPEKHVRLGDVVVSRDHGVLQYDMVKLARGKIETRDTSAPPSARMVRAVQLLEARRIAGDNPWEEYIARCYLLENAIRPGQETDILHDSREPEKVVAHPAEKHRNPEQPKIHYGLIGSANVLLKDPRKRDYLRDRFGVRAVEMEGSGIADGTWGHGKNYLLIRGICDYCDSYKNDAWQNYAAVAAAAYMRSLLEILPSEY